LGIGGAEGEFAGGQIAFVGEEGHGSAFQRFSLESHAPRHGNHLGQAGVAASAQGRKEQAAENHA